MDRQVILGIALSVILIFSIAAGALAQESKFSARVLAKGSKSNVAILVKNSSKSTESIYEFTVKFTKGEPISSIVRGGWNEQKDGNTVTFTTQSNAIKPGSTAVFLIRVSDPARSAFEWTMKGQGGMELQSGEVTKIKISKSKPKPEVPKVTKAEITVNPVRVNQGGQTVVTGKGFSLISSVQIFLDDQQQLTTSTTNGAGEFTAVVIIPSGAAPGAHMITAKDSFGKSSLIQILIEGSAAVTESPCRPGQLILTVCIDKTEYKPGDVIKLIGTAVFGTTVSLQIIDPQGGTICGANPQVNNATFTWEAVCFLPNSAPGGTYVVQAKQITHKTGTKFTVKAPTGGTGGAGGITEPGENPGPLKLFTDKPSYKSGETVQITVEGANAKSTVEIRIVGIGKILGVTRETSDERGVVVYNFQLVGAEPGTYKISATTKEKWVIRAAFEVIE